MPQQKQNPIEGEKIKVLNLYAGIGGNRKLWGRIRDMIVTFLRRWWVTNRLQLLTKKTGIIWILEEDFVSWVLGSSLNEQARPQWWYQEAPEPSWVNSLVLSRLLYEKKSQQKKESEIRNIISECQQVGFIKENSDEQHIKVDTRGAEIYSWTYLVWGHDYARKIWTAVIAGLVVLFIINQISDIEPQKVQVEVIQIKSLEENSME